MKKLQVDNAAVT